MCVTFISEEPWSWKFTETIYALWGSTDQNLWRYSRNNGRSILIWQCSLLQGKVCLDGRYHLQKHHSKWNSVTESILLVHINPPLAHLVGYDFLMHAIWHYSPNKSIYNTENHWMYHPVMVEKSVLIHLPG